LTDRRGHSAALIVGWVVALSACTQLAPTPEVTPNVAFQELLNGLLATAADDGANADQIASLEAAREVGAITPEVMRQALENYGQCVAELGMTYSWGDPTGPPDFPTFTFRVSVPTGISNELMDTCYASHARLLHTAYQLQPALREAQGRVIAEHRDAIIACLADAGTTIEPDATVDELRRAVMTAATGVIPGEVDSPPPGFTPHDCSGAAGMTIREFGY